MEERCVGCSWGRGRRVSLKSTAAEGWERCGQRVQRGTEKQWSQPTQCPPARPPHPRSSLPPVPTAAEDEDGADDDLINDEEEEDQNSDGERVRSAKRRKANGATLAQHAWAFFLFLSFFLSPKSVAHPRACV